MKYYVYIDETGDFEKSTSSVCAFISPYNHTQIEEKINNAVNQFNSENLVQFDSSNIHIAPMLHPNTRGVNPDEASRWRDIDEQMRKNYAEHLRKLLDEELAEAYIKSENKTFQLGEENAQTRYGQCLYALIHKLNEIKGQLKSCSSFDVTIATRHENCLPKSTEWHTYHDSLCDYINQWFESGTVKQSKFSNKTSMNMADVACYFLRKEPENCANVFTTQPNEPTKKQYTEDKNALVQALLNENMNFAAYTLADSSMHNNILKKLNKNSPESEFKQFIELATTLLENRTTEKMNFEEAELIIEHCLKTAPSESILTTAYGLKLAIINHQGKTQGQGQLFKSYTHALNKLNLPHFTQQDLILELKNRALNQQFNNFNFAKIIENFEDEIDKRNKNLAENTCSLQGKCYSTLGQAYAFYAAVENDKEMWTEAKKFFKKAQLNFRDDDKNFNQTTHYQTAGQWYFNDETADTHPQDTVWDLLNNVRITATQDLPKNELIKKANSYASKAQNFNANTHPIELIHKWIGIMYLKTECYKKAQNSFNSAYIENQGATLNIINLSIKALEIIGHKLNQNCQKAQQLMDEFQQTKTSLIGRISGFKTYMTDQRDRQWREDLESLNIDAIAKWLPFTYS